MNQNENATTTNANENGSAKESPAIKSLDFSADKVNIGPIRVNNNKKVFYMTHGKDMIFSETPWLYAPFGAGSYDPKSNGASQENSENRGLQWSLNLSASVRENDSEAYKNEVKHYFDQWALIDEKMLKYGVDNFEALGLKKSKKSSDEGVVEIAYTSVVKEDSAPDGKQYPRKIQPKISKAYENGNVVEDRPNISVYLARPDASQKSGYLIVPKTCNSFEELQRLIPKNSQVKCILQPRTYVLAQKYGVSLNIMQVLVKERETTKLEGFGFKETAMPRDVNGNVSTPAPASTPVESAQVVVVPKQQDSDDEGGEEQVVEEPPPSIKSGSSEEAEDEPVVQPEPPKKTGRPALAKATTVKPVASKK